MGEGLGDDAALRLLLQAVVADRGRGGERLGGVARVELLHEAGMVSPDARVAVGLQLHFHGDLVVLGLRGAATRRFEALEVAGELLHVVAHLVRDHVGLGEIARRAEAVLQLAIEGQVDVDAMVIGTIERTHRRLREAARGLHRAGEEHELRILVVAPELLLEDRAPGVLRVREDDGHELRHLVLGGGSGSSRVCRRPRVPGNGLSLAAAVEDDGGVPAHEVHHEGEDGHADAAAYDGQPAPAGINDVVASPAFFPSHGAPPRG